VSNIQKFYDEVLVFNDSPVIVALFLIFNMKSNCNIVELKDKIENLTIADDILEGMLVVQENYTTKEFKQIITQLSGLDGIIRRYKINDPILKFNKSIIKKIRKKYKGVK
jgi:hypothetical protein